MRFALALILTGFIFPMNLEAAGAKSCSGVLMHTTANPFRKNTEAHHELRSAEGFVGINAVGDEEYPGEQIYRSKVARVAPRPGGDPDLIEIVSYFKKFSSELGFSYDSSKKILSYPSPSLLELRMKDLDQSWGIRNGMMPKLVSGIIDESVYARMLAFDNRFPYSDWSDPSIHYHDAKVHLIPFALCPEVIQIASGKLRFLIGVQEALQKALKDPKVSANSKNKIRSYLADLGFGLAGLIQEQTLNIESETTSISFALVNFSKGEAKRGTEALGTAIETLAADSADDLKNTILENPSLPDEVRTVFEQTAASQEKISDPKATIKLLKQRLK